MRTNMPLTAMSTWRGIKEQWPMFSEHRYWLCSRYYSKSCSCVSVFYHHNSEDVLHNPKSRLPHCEMPGAPHSAMSCELIAEDMGMAVWSQKRHHSWSGSRVHGNHQPLRVVENNVGCVVWSCCTQGRLFYWPHFTVMKLRHKQEVACPRSST